MKRLFTFLLPNIISILIGLFIFFCVTIYLNDPAGKNGITLHKGLLLAALSSYGIHITLSGITWLARRELRYPLYLRNLIITLLLLAAFDTVFAWGNNKSAVINVIIGLNIIIIVYTGMVCFIAAKKKSTVSGSFGLKLRAHIAGNSLYIFIITIPYLLVLFLQLFISFDRRVEDLSLHIERYAYEDAEKMTDNSMNTYCTIHYNQDIPGTVKIDTGNTGVDWIRLVHDGDIDYRGHARLKVARLQLINSKGEKKYMTLEFDDDTETRLIKLNHPDIVSITIRPLGIYQGSEDNDLVISELYVMAKKQFFL